MVGKPSYEELLQRVNVLEKLAKKSDDNEKIFNSIDHPIFILNSEHQVISSNYSTEKALGCSLKKLIGKKCYHILHGPETNSPPKNCPMQKMIKSGQLEIFEMEVETLKGTFLVSCTPIFDDNGQLDRVIHIATDITQRKRTEEALRESEEKFRTIFENANDEIIYIDLNGTIIDVNNKILDVFGYNREEVIGKNFREFAFFKAEDMQKVINNFHNAASGKITSLMEFEAIRKDDTPVFIEVNTKLIKKNGVITGFVHIIRDVTERKVAEKAIEESEERYRSLVDASPIPIAIHCDSKIVFINEAGAEMFGAENAEEMTGMPMMDLIHPDYHQVVEDRINQQIVDNKKAPPLDEKLLRLDGEEIIVTVSSAPIIYQGIPTTQVAFNDITKRKQAETEREELILELQNALNKVKQLSGLLPICSNCKRIRDDKGYWRQLELFIREHSEVEFSHSLCEECSEKLYGDQEWFKELKERKKDKNQ